MNSIMELLRRRYGGIPVWVFVLVGIGILAWWIHRRQSQRAASDQSTAEAAAQTFPNAQPMNYSSDVFVNVQQPATPDVINITVPPGGPPHTVPPGTTPPAPPKKTSVTYVVKPGDTLWGIASKLLGSGFKNTAIYQANKAQIETVARQHGFASSQDGHWIWAGEKLVIPA